MKAQPVGVGLGCSASRGVVLLLLGVRLVVPGGLEQREGERVTHVRGEERSEGKTGREKEKEGGAGQGGRKDE